MVCDQLLNSGMVKKYLLLVTQSKRFGKYVKGKLGGSRNVSLQPVLVYEFLR